MEELEKYVGKRILWCLTFSGAVHEGILQEISPSGRYIKIDDKWYRRIEVNILECLEVENAKQ